MASAKPPARKPVPRKNLVAIDGTLDRLYKLQIVILEEGKNAEPFELRIIDRDAVREYVDCHNPDCYAGGFSLGSLLREMVAGRQEEFIGTSFCTGRIGEEDEGVLSTSCTTRFHIEATLRYR